MPFYKVNGKLVDAYSLPDKTVYKNLRYLQGDGNIKCNPLDLLTFVLDLSNETRSNYGYGMIVDKDTEYGLISCTNTVSIMRADKF